MYYIKIIGRALRTEIIRPSDKTLDTEKWALAQDKEGHGNVKVVIYCDTIC